MFEQLINSESGVAVFPFISLFICMGIFIAVIIWVIRMKPPYLEKMSRLPIEESHFSKEETNRA